MGDNPRDWLHLNWVHNHERFYFSGTHLSNYIESKKKHSFEMLKYDNNCKESEKTCYISGLPIKPGDSKCSNILQLSTVTMLCGIPNSTYKTECSEILGNNSDFINRYKSFQEVMWSLVYGWGNNTCIKVKGNHPFLKINFTLKGLKLLPFVQTSDNIKKLLGTIFYGGVKSFTPIVPVGTNIDQYVLDRYESMCQRIEQIESKLKSYDKRELKKCSCVSTKVTLNMIIHHVLHHGPFKWVKPLYTLFQNSEDMDVATDLATDTATDTSIHTFLDFVKNNKIDESTQGEQLYYDESTLPSDVIYGSLLLLKKKSTGSDLFTDMGMVNLPNMLHLDVSDNEDIENFEKFCVFFRYYVNSENTIQHIINSHVDMDEDTLNMNFKKEIISITNYIWNLYSSYYNLEEAIINGSSDTLDELTKGPKLDDRVKELKDIITIMKLLESMGNELTDKAISMSDEGTSTRGKDKKKSKQWTHKKQTKKQTKKPIKTPNILHNMKFMMGNKEISF